MAAQRHEISLRVLKNISRVSPPFELFMMNLKLQNAAQRHFVFVERYVVKLLSRCVTFSNVLFNCVFGLFINN